MNESFLHYLWKFKLLNTHLFTSTDNDLIEIIDFGTHNLFSGPDFFNAKIKIDQVVYVGNIEFHVNSSDWDKHNHQNDHAYNNVVLHVVYEHDKEIFVKNKELPTVELKYLIDGHLLSVHQNLIEKKNISCSSVLPKLNDFDWIQQLDFMAINRLERKTNENLDLLLLLNQDLSKLFIVLLGKALGGPVNKDAFELLSQKLDTKEMAKFIDNPTLVEAYVLGLAGYIDKNDSYAHLQHDWNYLKSLFNLTPLDVQVWKYGRLRPQGFPEVRLVQFARLLSLKTAIFQYILEKHGYGHWMKVLTIPNFQSGGVECKISKKVKHLILVNAILPFRNVLMKRKGQEFVSYNMEILENIPAENNFITKKWSSFYTKIDSMLDSQALIEMYNEFCLPKQCLNCKFGVKFMAQ